MGGRHDRAATANAQHGLDPSVDGGGRVRADGRLAQQRARDQLGGAGPPSEPGQRNGLARPQRLQRYRAGHTRARRGRGLHPKNLSRAVEDSATVTANLVPWNSGGAYQAGVLGVATIAYLPFNFFCWLSPIVTIVFGVMGWTIQKDRG